MNSAYLLRHDFFVISKLEFLVAPTLSLSWDPLIQGRQIAYPEFYQQLRASGTFCLWEQSEWVSRVKKIE